MKAIDYIASASKIVTDSCIEWPYYVDKKGYGWVRFMGGMARAHRVMMILYGPPELPGKDEVAHLPIVCHNRACINLRHLYWASRRDNLNDCKIDGTVLSDEDAAELRELRATGKYSYEELGREFGIRKSQVGNIINGKSHPL